jgi:hypothetical protein
LLNFGALVLGSECASETELSQMDCPGNRISHLAGRKPRRHHAACRLAHPCERHVRPAYWLRGGASAVLPGFTPGSYFDAIEKWRPTALNMVPTMLGMLLEQNRAVEMGMSSARTRRATRPTSSPSSARALPATRLRRALRDPFWVGKERRIG